MTINTQLTHREVDVKAARRLQEAGVHPLFSRLVAARGVRDPAEVVMSWGGLIPPSALTSSDEAACILADAISERKKLLIIADYDCDGATACAVGVRGLRMMGADVDFLVPNRFETGYGLSPEVVEIAARHPKGKPDMLITVDNGIASVEGVEAARKHGIDVLVTDHHLPGDTLPDALAIVNPNKPGCTFPSKNLAGVGVIFYILLALRSELRRRGVFPLNGGPRLDHLSDLVALGTVADVVKLDTNNRIIVTQGLNRIRAGSMQPGIRALFEVAGRDPSKATTFDLGFGLGPRINAAGRLADMSVGINCLITDDFDEATALARQLNEMNLERREIETGMRDEALAALETNETPMGATVCVYRPDWHQGVVGLVASRLKELYWRPTLAFAKSDEGELRASGRSIPGVHLRDALDLVSKRYPGIILKFGGHAMAAGLTLREDALETFVRGFDQVVRELTGKDSFEPTIETDGSLEPEYVTVEVAQMLAQHVWGAGFPAPTFCDTFEVKSQRLLKDKHLKMQLVRDGCLFDAIWFNQAQLMPEFIDVAYRLDVNEWNGYQKIQLIVEHAKEYEAPHEAHREPLRERGAFI